MLAVVALSVLAAVVAQEPETKGLHRGKVGLVGSILRGTIGKVLHPFTHKAHRTFHTHKGAPHPSPKP
jgi:hypothetical protein